jgi:hypothetical protein
VDDVEPTIDLCPDNITIVLSEAEGSAVVTWDVPTAYDFFDNLELDPTDVPSNAAGTSFTPGETTVAYTFQDRKGNEAMCSFGVNIVDNERPTIQQCPTNITVALGGENRAAEAKPSWERPTAFDNYQEGVVLTGPVTSPRTGLESGDAFPVGQLSSVQYVASDSSGNQVTCEFWVAVSDIEPPTFDECPPDVRVVLPDGASDVALTWTAPTASDNVDGDMVLHHPFSRPLMQLDEDGAGGTFPPGAADLQYRVSDASGNIASCNFTITVVDGEGPTFDGCPPAAAVAATPVGGEAEVYAIVAVLGPDESLRVVRWPSPSATDNVDDADSLDVAVSRVWPKGGLSGNASASSFPRGETVVRYTSADAAGNTVNCSFRVAVLDQTPPQWERCPGPVSANLSATSDRVRVGWESPVARDAVDGVVSVTRTSSRPTSGLSSGALFLVGTTAMVYTAEDQVGNRAECHFNVTVADVAPPVMSACPAKRTEYLAGERATASVTLAWPTAVDAVDGAVAVAAYLTDDPARSPNTPPQPLPIAAAAAAVELAVGQNMVRYVATDSSGNAAECVVDVAVVDLVPPLVSGCQPNVSVFLGKEQAEASASWSVPQGVDNVDGAVLPSISGSSLAPGDAVARGSTHTVTYRFRDSAGNEAACTTVVRAQEAISFRQPLYEVEVAEDQPAGATVGLLLLESVEPYSVAVENGDGVWDVGSTSPLTLRISMPLDREAVRWWNLSVVATGSVTGRTASTLVRVRVLDVNDNAPAFEASTLYGFVSEDAARNTRVALFAPDGTSASTLATDPDAGRNGAVTTSLTGSGGGVFALDDGLVLLGTLDREAVERYKLTLQASDDGNVRQTSTISVVITVLDVNDNPPKLAAQTAFQMTTAAPGRAVGTVVASDVDSDNTLEFAIVALGQGFQDPASLELFAIHRTSGVISVVSPLAPPPHVYSFTVAVSDGRFASQTAVEVSVRPNPACLGKVCPAHPCFGPPTCIGDGECVLGKRLGSTAACVPSCSCAERSASADGGLVWAETSCGTLQVAECPAQAFGLVKRLCGRTGEWELSDFGGCVRGSILKIAAGGVSRSVDLDQLGDELAGATGNGAGLGSVDVSNIGVVLRDVASLGRDGGITEKSAAGLIESASNMLDAQPSALSQSQQMHGTASGIIDLLITFQPWLRAAPALLDLMDLAWVVRTLVPQFTEVVVKEVVVKEVVVKESLINGTAGAAAAATVTVALSCHLDAADSQVALSQSALMLAAQSQTGSRQAGSSLLLEALHDQNPGLYGLSLRAVVAQPLQYRTAPTRISQDIERFVLAMSAGLDKGRRLRVSSKNIEAQALKLDCSAAPAAADLTLADGSSVISVSTAAAEAACGYGVAELSLVSYEGSKLLESRAPAVTGADPVSVGGCTVVSRPEPPHRVLTVQAPSLLSSGKAVRSSASASSSSSSSAAAAAVRRLGRGAAVGRGRRVAVQLLAAVSYEMELAAAPAGYNNSVDDSACVRWDDASERWSSAGCWRDTNASSTSRTVCRCTNSRGHFTVLPAMVSCSQQQAAGPSSVVKTTFLVVLLAVVPFFVVAFTFAAWPKIRTVPRTIEGHYSFASGMALLLFCLAASRDASFGSGGCSALAMAAHYFFLAVAMWVLIDTRCLWRTHRRVQGYGAHMGERDAQWPQLAAVAYGLPLLVVAATAASGVDSNYGSERSCWLEGRAVVGFVGPLALTSALNCAALLFLATKGCSQPTEKKTLNARRESEVDRYLRVSMVRLALFVLTWAAAGAAAEGVGPALPWAFVVCATVHGVATMLMHVALDEEVITCWRHSCGRGGGSLPVSGGGSGVVVRDSSGGKLRRQERQLGGGGGGGGGGGAAAGRHFDRRSDMSAANAPSPPMSVVAEIPGMLFNRDRALTTTSSVTATTTTVAMGRSSSIGSKHRRRGATSARQEGYWEGIPVSNLGMAATPNMHAPIDDFPGFSGSDSARPESSPSGRTGEDEGGLHYHHDGVRVGRQPDDGFGFGGGSARWEDTPPPPPTEMALPGYPQAEVLISEFASTRGDPAQYSAWGTIPREPSVYSSVTSFDGSLLVPADGDAVVTASPTRALLMERESAVRWSSQQAAQVSAGGAPAVSDKTLLRTAKVLALRDPRLTYLLHFEPSELRLLQDRLHDLV